MTQPLPERRLAEVTREELFAKTATHRIRKSLPLPTDEEPLHPLAAALREAVDKAHLDPHKRASPYRMPNLPTVVVSKSLAPRVAKAFHVILHHLARVGIPFRKARGSYNAGYFEREGERLCLSIEESLGDDPAAYRPDEPWRYVYRQSKPSGRLVFTLKTDEYQSKRIGEWSESSKLRLEKLLAQVVAAIRLHYVEARKRRIQEAIEAEKRRIESEQRHREWLAQEAIRRREEQIRRHRDALASAKAARTRDLWRAAGWWQLSRTLDEFIDACESRWREESGEITEDKRLWLAWARTQARYVSPFESGYPDPARDGAFEPESIPMEGPYPETRQFPLPPNMIDRS
jgi:hypothetical protein